MSGIADWTVEIRDATRKRVGMLGMQDMTGLTLTVDAVDTGSWSLDLPASSQAAPLLTTPGAGIIVTMPDGTRFTGPATSCEWTAGPGETLGDHWTISGAGDGILMSRAPILPDPSKGIGEQTRDKATWAGDRGALLCRALSCLKALTPTPALPAEGTVTDGDTATLTADWQTVLEGVQSLAMRRYAVQITQDATGTGLTASVSRARDLTHAVVYDTGMGGLKSFNARRKAPAHTRAIYKWTHDNNTSTWLPTSVDALTALEDTWGRRISVLDLQGEYKTTEDAQKAADGLARADASSVLSDMASASGTITDGTLLDGVHAGDMVSVSDGFGGLMTATVTSITTGFTDGVIQSATLGDWTAAGSRLAYAERLRMYDRRLSRLERK